jgi:hypothetical protein
MKNYLEKHTKIFEDFDIPKITLYRKRKEVDFDTIQSLQANMRHIRRFRGYANNLLEREICPLLALLEKNIIHPKTIEMLEQILEQS